MRGNSNPLIYADDMVVFFKATLESCSNVKQVVVDFCELAGLTINKGKSSIIFIPNTASIFKRMMTGVFQAGVSNK